MRKQSPTLRASRVIAAALAATAALSAGAAAATLRVPPEAEARLRAIYEERRFEAAAFRGRWLPDGSGYTVLETPDGASAPELARYAVESGERRVVAALSRLVPPGAAEPLVIEDYALSPQGDWLLIETDGRETDGRRVADLWVLQRSASAPRRIVRGAERARLSFSPDGRRVLYVDGGDLHVHDLEHGRTRPLTGDAEVGRISNGGAVWSPDGERIAYVQSDASRVRVRHVLVPGDPSYPEVRDVRFARVGTPIAVLRVGVVPAAGGETRWVALPTSEEGFYLGELSWIDARELLVEWRTRSRDARRFLIADTASGEVTLLYEESDPAWVVASYRVNAGLEWVRDGRAAVLLSERDGRRHAWLLSRESGERTLLTPGDSEVIRRVGTDAAGGWFYYTASPGNATQQYLYRVGVDGSAPPERVTPQDQTGWHDYDPSPDGRWAFHTRSTFDTPPVTELVSLAGHRVVRVLEDNAELRRGVEPLIARPTEFLKLDIGGGVVMDAWMLAPRDFDPGRRYPLFVYVYGEPHAQTVLDRWSAGQLYHRVIADLGYLVVSIDNRGTPAPKGARWRRAIFGSLGPLSTEEQAAGVRELGRTRPYVDLDRVGIWGWSGGGSNTLNAMFRRPDVYHVGIAVAPKPQPHLYNAWFQEIYMRTLEDNAEGYRRAAPLEFAEGLAGDLLIVHGTGETNTHLEITEGLVDRLIALGKRFDYMTYPNRDHGIRRGEGTSLHLRMLMARYLLEHLPAGPRDRGEPASRADPAPKAGSSGR